ncbi:HAD-IB family hydrolase [Sphingorhabdus sp. Alg239-R122]|uniref:HAD family hydrolase n=1 Tax=Sphingorhabdus sp. Alg239-R122 TaxID=2305989 RepID=UPI001F073C9B|nr:HAD-IB family hydrolase [Sphingorhabdus sp. Alg239-R122]
MQKGFMQKIAIYDMDRTITRSGTYTPFLMFAALRKAPWRLVLAPLALLWMSLYALKIISRAKLKELNLTLLIGGRFDRRDVEQQIDEYSARTIADNSYAEAIAQIETDRENGYRLVLATASYHLYVDAIAARLGFDDVIATELEQDGTQVVARIINENCYDEAKLRKIRAWMDREELVRENCDIRAYSDHISDMPMLEFADHPVATNPSAALRREAVSRGWPIHDWN